ncbi:MAG: amidohydrolase family protein [Gemmatimonadaceae bacterium]
MPSPREQHPTIAVRAATPMRRTAVAALAAAVAATACATPTARSSTSERSTAVRVAAGGRAARPTPSRGAAPGATAFVNVTVLPMDSERVLERQTVVVRDGRIAALGPTSRVSVPAGAARIDGAGKYLMPGLAEMHAHVPGANAPQQLVRDIMFLYVANGVTTIRGMLGAPNQLTLRAQTASGEVLGPTIFVGAPSLSGTSAPTPDVAARLIREHKAAGYDFLKLHPGLSRTVYDTIVATSRAVGITFAGHISQAVGLDHTLASRQSTIDHLDGYVEASASDEVKARMLGGEAVPLGEMMRGVDDARIRRYAAATREAGVWNVPTAFLWESFSSTESPEVTAQRPEMKYAPRTMVAGWVNQKRTRDQTDRRSGVTAEDARAYLAARRKVLKALGDAGAPLLMGTDSPQMFNVPGFALHREIALMAEVGLTPYQILAAGTRNVATYAERDLKLDGKFGTVAVGNRADLVLLDANPLADIANVAKRAGVMVRGRWVPASEIGRMLDELAARNAAAPPPAAPPGRAR